VSQQMRNRPGNGRDERFHHLSKDGSDGEFKRNPESPYAEVVEGMAADVPVMSSTGRGPHPPHHHPITNYKSRAIQIHGETAFTLTLSFCALCILLIREVQAYLLVLALALALGAMHSFLASAVIRSTLRVNLVTSNANFRLLTKAGELVTASQQPHRGAAMIRRRQAGQRVGAASPLDGTYSYCQKNDNIFPCSFEHGGQQATPSGGVMERQHELKDLDRAVVGLDEKEVGGQLPPSPPALPFPLVRTHSLSSYNSNPSRASSPSSSSSAALVASSYNLETAHSNKSAALCYQQHLHRHHNNSNIPGLVEVQIDVFPCRTFVSSPGHRHHHQQLDVVEGVLGSSPSARKSAALAYVVNFDIFVEGVSARLYRKNANSERNQSLTSADPTGVGDGSTAATNFRNIMEPALHRTFRRIKE